MGELKYEEYRQPWETGPHWELKREFIEKYSDMFPEDRLLCLAQAYSNVVLMNCSYPGPVMRQISLLSEPLQMRKRFQGVSNSSEADTEKKPKTQQQRVAEKMKAIYADSGRPFKQVKFCASGEKTSDSESTSKQPEMKCFPTFNQDAFYSGGVSDCVSSETHTSESQPSAAASEIQENALQLTSEERKILSTLGSGFIQEFAQAIRTFQAKRDSPVESISCAAQKLKIHDKVCYDISTAPDATPTAPNFCSKFSVDSCVVSVGTASNKKKAKLKSAEIAIDILTKLSSADVSTSDRDTVAIKSESNSFNSNQTTILIQEVTNRSEKSVLQYFSEKVVNRNRVQPVTVVLKSICRSLNMKFNRKSDIAFDITSDSKSAQDSQYICKFFIKNILISSGRSTTFDQAKELAIEAGFIKLENLSKYEIHNDELIEIQSSKDFDSSTSDSSVKHSVIKTEETERIPFVLNKRLFNSSIRDNFMLVDNFALKPVSQRNLKTLLMESATFCRKLFQFRVVDTDPQSVTAYAVLGEAVVGTGIAYSKDAAKLVASENAVEILRKQYYTLKVKNEYIDGYIISQNQVQEGASFSSGALTESNIGCKMLKSMGWTGGGLGESGIAEPVEAQGHSFGSGLGYQTGKGDLRLFRKRIESMLQDYKNTNTLSGLVFSKDFSKEERKEIHKMAQRLHLHSASRGTKENRFLTVRHKYSPTDVLQYLARNGGSSTKFDLVDKSETPFECVNV